jgi:hypothetical protein
MCEAKSRFLDQEVYVKKHKAAVHEKKRTFLKPGGSFELTKKCI